MNEKPRLITVDDLRNINNILDSTFLPWLSLEKLPSIYDGLAIQFYRNKNEAADGIYSAVIFAGESAWVFWDYEAGTYGVIYNRVVNDESN